MFSKPLSRFYTLTYGQTYKISALKNKVAEMVPKKQAELKTLKSKYGDRQIARVTVEQAIGGMRDAHLMLYDTSLLDKYEGIRFRGHSIPELCERLQKAPGGGEPLPEALMWLLLTGEIPTDQECKEVIDEFKARSVVSEEVERYVLNLPKEMHPMTQLSMALLRLQTTSLFAKAYSEGMTKAKYWEATYEDAMNLVAKIPRLAALIYRNKYRNGDIIAPDSNLDWAGNYAHMLGFTQHEIKECFRSYLTIHSDHEGGNVSAHTTHLVGSALSDPYLSYSAGLNGLAGPLHGLANQEVLKWLLDLKEELGDHYNEEKVREFAQRTLKSGKVIPGYGHAVLRNTDPRYLHQRDFAAKYIKNDPLVNLCSVVFKVVPPLLKELGKVKNPWPNVDAHSGVLLYHYGIREFDYYTVSFGVSRALGCMANLVWSRALGLPIERPGSVTIEWVKKHFEALDHHQQTQSKI